MALQPEDKLRQLLGEQKPGGGADTDTLFTDAEIDALLDDSNGNIEVAAFEGWRAKAAKFASLVDVTDGNASRKMSQLAEHANNMAAIYRRSSSGNTEGRTRIGRIVRES